MADKPKAQSKQVTIGQAIGVVKHNLDITLDNGTKANAKVHIDFTSATDIDIKSGLCSNRVISGQRAWRKMSLDEFEHNVNDATFMASAIGQKVKTHAEKVTLLRDTMSSLGYDEEQIELACNNVDRFIDGLQKTQ